MYLSLMIGLIKDNCVKFVDGAFLCHNMKGELALSAWKKFQLA